MLFLTNFHIGRMNTANKRFLEVLIKTTKFCCLNIVIKYYNFFNQSFVVLTKVYLIQQKSNLLEMNKIFVDWIETINTFLNQILIDATNNFYYLDIYHTEILVWLGQQNV